MAKRTSKVGITGRYGPRYGVKIRNRIKSVSRHRTRPSRCPECQHDSVKRVSSGIWHCRHCDLKFAASAYSTRVRSYIKEVAESQTTQFESEDEANLSRELGKEPAASEPREAVPEPQESEELPEKEK